MSAGGRSESLSCKAAWRLNHKACPAALQLSEGDFAEHYDACVLRLQEMQQERLLAFVLGMTSRNPLPDFSLQWCLTRFEDFLFLERIVVEPSLRRSGVGSGLLERAVQWSREAGLTSLYCQVHDRPVNRDAHAFVLARGFTAIESVMLPSRDIVTMYQRSTATATP
jgi:predicted GNAT superfamily acetyltransferase